jgi:pSer/pThr/pTyr-binding forkhead associated (FHA) protein
MAELALMKDDVVINRWPLESGTLTIGRHDSNDIVIQEEAVSSKHARLLVEKDPHFDGMWSVTIEDLGSTNGTFVNGDKVDRAPIDAESKIKIAYSDFRLLDPAREGTDQTAYIADG